MDDGEQLLLSRGLSNLLRMRQRLAPAVTNPSLVANDTEALKTLLQGERWMRKRVLRDEWKSYVASHLAEEEATVFTDTFDDIWQELDFEDIEEEEKEGETNDVKMKQKLKEKKKKKKQRLDQALKQKREQKKASEKHLSRLRGELRRATDPKAKKKKHRRATAIRRDMKKATLALKRVECEMQTLRKQLQL